MKIKEILAALEKYAPLPLQDGFDNAGLQVGLTDVELTGALLCLDVTEEVIDEAVALECNLIVSHHPLLFKPLKTLTGKSYIERCVMKAVQYGITLYAAHTNLDNAAGGVNFKIAEKIGLKRVRILQPKENSLLKLVTFVPVEQADEVRGALFAAGCGNIGNYDCCSYNLQGDGTFRAGAGTHPFCGEEGKLHRENEIRIETVLPAYRQNRVVKALLAVHPYEEPAYDLYPLSNSWTQTGSGIMGELERPECEMDFLQRIKKIFGVECLRHNALTGRMISSVALCGGAGAFLLPQAIASGADIFITGEIGYHSFFGHEQEILMAEIGHFESEQYTVELLYEWFGQQFPHEIFKMTRVRTNSIYYL